MLKLIAGIIIVFCTSKIGYMCSNKFKLREKTLSDLQDALKMIEFEIYFLNTTVTQTIGKIAKSIDNLRPLFLEIEMYHGQKEIFPNISMAWEQALKNHSKSLCLNQSDVNIIVDFASKLGLGDVKSEQSNVQSTCLKLNMAQADAAIISAKNCRLFKSLGILSGLTIVILLI